MIAFAVLGILYALARRRWVIAFLGIAAPIALAYYIAHSTAWLQFKSFTITGVFALTLAFAGAAALHESRRRVVALLGWLVAAVLAGAVLYGNAITYHDTTLAPAARYYDLAAIGKRYAGQGPALFPAFDEYAEYFLREEQGTSSENPAKGEYDLAPGVVEPGGVGFSLNLNQFSMPYLQRFNLIVQPRGPLANRAPANWDLVQRDPILQRLAARPSRRRHIRASAAVGAAPRAHPRDLRRAAEGSARRPARGRRSPMCPPPRAHRFSPRPASTPTTGNRTATRLSPTAPVMTGSTFTLARTATYEVWIEGTIGRPVKFLVDGHTVGTVAYEERYPNQSLYVGAVTLAAGRHTLEMVRGGGSLHPGSGDDIDPDTRRLGSVVLLPKGSQTYRVHVAPASSAAKICAAPVGYEWMEVLHPGAASAQL